MKKIIWAIVILIIVVLIVISFSKKEITNGEVIKIGSISALTGVGSAIGEEERKGALLAVEEINNKGGIKGKKLELVSEDLSLDKLKNAVSVANKLIDIDGVVAIVGAQWDEPVMPILPIIEKAKVPMVGADNSDQVEKENNYEYFFATWYDNRVGIRELLRFAQAKNIKNIAIIRPIDGDFWKFTADTLLNEAPNYGINIVEDINMGNPLSLDFRTHLAKIKIENPDAIFIVTSDYNQCAFLKQKSELGLNMLALGTESSGDYVSLENCPDLMTNTFFSSPVQDEKYEKFANSFEKKYGELPKFPSAVTAYDAVYVIAEALKKTNGEGGEVLRNEIASTKISGVSLSEIRFNEKGFVMTPEDAFVMMNTQQGKFVSVEY